MQTDRVFTAAKWLIIIPLALLGLTMLFLAIGAIADVPKLGDDFASFFLFIGFIGMVALPWPGLILSVIGAALAGTARKRGSAKATRYIVLGVILAVIFAGLAVIVHCGAMSV